MIPVNQMMATINLKRGHKRSIQTIKLKNREEILEDELKEDKDILMTPILPPF